MNSVEKLHTAFFEAGRAGNMRSDDLERGLVAILATMAAYRPIDGHECRYLYGITNKALEILSDAQGVELRKILRS